MRGAAVAVGEAELAAQLLVGVASRKSAVRDGHRVALTSHHNADRRTLHRGPHRCTAVLKPRLVARSDQGPAPHPSSNAHHRSPFEIMPTHDSSFFSRTQSPGSARTRHRFRAEVKKREWCTLFMTPRAPTSPLHSSFAAWQRYRRYTTDMAEYHLSI